MSVFERAFHYLMELEGVYSNDVDDPGGETKWGISQRAYPQLDIASLSREDAQRIYRRDYWDRLRCDEIPARVATEIFEAAVNLGVAREVAIIQRALNYLGENLTQDGRLGPLTMDALLRWSFRHETALLKVLNGLQFVHYLQIVERNPALKKYARGWMKRIEV